MASIHALCCAICSNAIFAATFALFALLSAISALSVTSALFAIFTFAICRVSALWFAFGLLALDPCPPEAWFWLDRFYRPPNLSDYFANHGI
jgi:hypothetical protein